MVVTNSMDCEVENSFQAPLRSKSLVMLCAYQTDTLDKKHNVLGLMLIYSSIF